MNENRKASATPPQANGAARGSGVTLLGLLGLLFLGLKLAGVGVVAGWSWWWVLAPFWVFPAIGVALLILAGLVWAVEAIAEIVAGKTKGH